ncbi:cell wall mannoprotein 1 family protein [Aspergillus lucknowensis]|uniref:Cell wall protein n=1 Tax=Aspergillus lucknowensis TaxID=176173 RepID=A0ABR4LX96_9EURO
MKFTTVSTLPTLWLFTTLSTLALGAGVTSNPTSSLLNLLTAKLTTLNTVISSYTDDADILSIQSASNAVIITIDRGLRDISVGPELTAAETKALALQFQELTTSFKATISDLVDKKPLLDRFATTTCTSGSRSIQKHLHHQYAVWDKLFTLVLSKAPEVESTVVAHSAEDILARIQGGLDTFVDVGDSTTPCAPDTPPARIELRSYSNGNSSTDGNGTSTQPPSVPTQSSTGPASPDFTGAAVAVAAGETGMRMVGMGVLAVAVAVAL